MIQKHYRTVALPYIPAVNVMPHQPEPERKKNLFYVALVAVLSCVMPWLILYVYWCLKTLLPQSLSLSLSLSDLRV